MTDDPELSQTNYQTNLQFDLHKLDPVDDYIRRLSATLDMIKREEISAVIEVLFKAWTERKQILILGNGGSASTASHMANDLCKLTAINGKKRFKAMSLTDNMSLISAWGNDKSFEDIFAEQLVNYVEPGDVVIAISTSGNSLNVLKAMEVAKTYGAVRVGFTGVNGGQLKSLVDYCVFIPDEHMGRQEDGHMILDHVITNTLRWMISGETE